jgi:predicted nucleic acid-binding protein
MSVEFIDTNVLVYAHDVSSGKKLAAAGDLIERLVATRAAAVSVQVLLEFFVTVTRKVKKPLAWEQAREIVVDLATWRVHTPEGNDVLEAINIGGRYNISIWDAMIVQAAVGIGASVIWTEDLNDGQHYEGVKVCNPFV